MTLALYGKSRKRQGSLLLAAFLAIIAASVGGLAIISSAFAHHLVLTTQLPTCQNNSAWNLVVSEGGWSGYREAVLTVTDPTTPVALRFSPYIDNGTGSTTILSANGTGAVHTAGKVDQYLGSFTDGEPIAANMTASQTTITRLGGGAWDGDYQPGQVLQIDSELMKITLRSADDLTLTVQRAFGDSSATTHSAGGSSDDVFRWVRGAFDSGASPGTVTWNLQAEAPNCVAKIITKKVVTGTGANASQNFTANIVNTDDNSGEVNGLVFSQTAPDTRTWNEDDTTDDFEVNEVSIPANWTVTGTFIAEGDAACPSPTAGTWDTSTPSNAAGGALNNIANGDVVTVCFRNNYTAPATPSVSIDKTHDPAGPFGPGGTFKWKLAVTVTGASTNAITNITDTIPAPFVAEAFGSYTKPAAITCTDGDANASTVTCSLASGSAVGTYTIEIDITVPAQLTQDQCHLYNNTATITGTNVPTTPGGPTNSQSDTDSVTVTCNPSNPNFSKSDGNADAPNIYWTITIKNNNQFTSTYYVFDENAVLDSSDGCSPAASESPNDFFSCTLAAGATGHLYIHTAIPVHTVCEPVNVTNTAYLVTSNTLTPAQAKDPANQLASDGGTYHEDSNPDASCIKVKKENTGNGSWLITFINSSDKSLAVDFSDTYQPGATGTDLDSIATTGCSPQPAAGTTETQSTGCDKTIGVGNTTVVVTTDPLIAKCEAQTVSNTVAATFNGSPIGVASGGSLTASYTQPADTSLCSHTVKVCKIVVGNGDGIVDGGQFRFGSNPSNATVLLGSQTTEPAGDAVDGAQGTKNCVDLIVANTDTTIFEWGYRPGDGQGLTGTWNGDAAGFPKSTNGASDSCSTLPSNGTVSITSQTTEVTFCNKTNPRTEKILITKNFTGLNGYVPAAGDVPSFTLTPSTNTSCAAPVQQDTDTWTIECTVPAGWSATGTVTETPKPNWQQCQIDALQGGLIAELSGLVNEVMSIVSPYAKQFTFCNFPVGRVIVQKNDNTSNTNTGRPAQWNFEVDGSQTYQGSVALGGGQWITTNVPFGSYTASETNGHFDPSICPSSGNPNGNGYTSTDLTPGSQSLTLPGQTITFIFRNDDCGKVLGTGSLHVFKIRDINGNGVTDGGDTQIVWTVTIQGPEFPAGQVFNVPAAGLHLNGITEGVYTITESSQFGYTLVGVVSTENPGLVVSASTSVTIANNLEDTVIFYNRPTGQIPVHKNAFTSHNGGANVAAPNDDDGWTITLTSAQCGINQVKVTDANGDALFTGLPLCTDYVVSEGAVNASSPGFVPLTAAQFTNITPNGVTLTFNNILRTQDPPCINCGPTTTPTPVTPTATPPTTTPVPPTNTPVPPTSTPTSVSTVGGERTPGPGQPTPIAPSTGGGVLGGTAGGFNLLLIVAGLLALTSGVSFLALGRKNRR